ncbi:acetolactate synthase, catabolic, partial [Vibrio cholerae O1 str. NHCC-008D]
PSDGSRGPRRRRDSSRLLG